MRDHAPEEWMTVAQAAEFLGVSADTIARLYDRGHLNGWRTRGDAGARRILKDSAARRLKDEYDARRASER